MNLDSEIYQGWHEEDIQEMIVFGKAWEGRLSNR